MHLEYYIITNMRSQNAFLYPFWGDDDDYFPAMLDSVMKGLQRKSYYYYYYYMVSSANAAVPSVQERSFQSPIIRFSHSFDNGRPSAALFGTVNVHSFFIRSPK